MDRDIDRLTKAIVSFRDARDWKQFHNSKDLALALSIEAAELTELFLWKSPLQADRKRIAEELADVLTYALLLAHEEKLDVGRIIRAKLKANAKKYPVAKARGSARKYTEF